MNFLTRIGCFGWIIIFIVIMFFAGQINIVQEERKAEEARLMKEQQEQERLERVARQEKEAAIRKKEEDQTKLKLTSEMKNNEPGDTVDIYEVELTVSEPYETVLDLENESQDTVKRVAQFRSKVVTFDVTVKNSTDEEISFGTVKLTRPAYTILREYEFDRTYRYYAEDMDRYLRGEWFSTRDPIAPGGKKTGTLSFYIDSHFLTSSRRGVEAGSQNFELTFDVSRFPFLHSFEENKIKPELFIPRT